MSSILAACGLATLLPGTSGQCTMCEASVTGDWTYWDDHCLTKIGYHCLNDLGEWTNWYKCCGQDDLGDFSKGSGAANETDDEKEQEKVEPGIPGFADTDLSSDQRVVKGVKDSRGNPMVRVPFKVEGGGMDWVKQPLYANVHAKPSESNAPGAVRLLHQRIRSKPAKLRTLHQRIRSTPECDCSQIHSMAGAGCGANSTARSSRCQEQCCAEPRCDCSWASRGCRVSDSSACWSHCCLVDTKVSDRIELDEHEGIEVTGSSTLRLASPLTWTASGLLAATALSVVLFRASRRSGCKPDAHPPDETREKSLESCGLIKDDHISAKVEREGNM